MEEFEYYEETVREPDGFRSEVTVIIGRRFEVDGIVYDRLQPGGPGVTRRMFAVYEDHYNSNEIHSDHYTCIFSKEFELDEQAWLQQGIVKAEGKDVNYWYDLMDDFAYGKKYQKV